MSVSPSSSGGLHRPSETSTDQRSHNLAVSCVRRTRTGQPRIGEAKRWWCPGPESNQRHADFQFSFRQSSKPLRHSEMLGNQRLCPETRLLRDPSGSPKYVNIPGTITHELHRGESSIRLSSSYLGGTRNEGRHPFNLGDGRPPKKQPATSVPIRYFYSSLTLRPSNEPSSSELIAPRKLLPAASRTLSLSHSSSSIATP